MPWFERLKLPDRFKDKTPEEIEAEIAQLSEAAAKAEELKQKLQERENDSVTLRQQLEETSASLEELKKQMQPAPPPPQQTAELTDFFQDPEKAFQERATPILNLTLHNAAMMARSLAQQQLREEASPRIRAINEYIMRNYGKEVDELYNSMPLQNRTTEAAYKNCFSVVMARHMEDALKTAAGNQNAFEGAGGGTGAPPSLEKQDEQLSPEELHVARKMRLTPAQYLASKKKLEFIGDNYAKTRAN